MKPLLFLLFLHFFSRAQETLNGKIIDKNTGLGISLVTIGLVKQNTGTNTNEKGEFTISCKQPDSDSLLVTCVGYIPDRISVNDFKINPVINLAVSVKKLKPVIIKNKWTYADVGNYNNHKLEYCRTTNGFQSQVAIKMTAPFANTTLHSVNVQTSKYMGKSSMFRIHVFDIDSVSRGPGEELTDTSVLVTSKRGEIKIDMLPYQVLLPNREFFVSVEWLFIPYNEYHFVAKYEGKDSAFMHYSPGICFTKDPPASQEEIWELYYNGSWEPGSETKHSLAISAVVKY